MSSNTLSLLQIRLSMLVHIRVVAAVQRRPLGLVLEQAHSLDVVVVVGREAVVYAGGEDDQIVLLEPDADPGVALGPHVEVAGAVADVPDLFVLVQVLVEERLHFGLVDVAHGLRRDGDFIAVPVAALLGELVDGRQ